MINDSLRMREISRLKRLLQNDKSELKGQTEESLKSDMLAVLKNYMEIESDGLIVEIERGDECIVKALARGGRIS